MITKLFWATWHRDLGKLAMDVLGVDAEIADGAPYELTRLQRLFLFTRSDTIYAGSNEIQRNLIAERALGLPREPRVAEPTRRRPTPTAHGLLAGKTVLVTAAAGTGIGFAVARRCAEEGARVFLSDLHERRLGEAADELERETGVRPGYQLCDVTQQAQVDALVRAALDAWGHVDVLVNNAGLGGYAKVVEMTDEQWSKVLDVTLTGTFRMTRAVLPHMIARRARRDRQQRLGARLARAGGAGALRGGQGRRDGADALRRRWRPRRTACASTRCRRASRCTSSSRRSRRRACSTSSPRARPSAAAPSRGRSPT